MRGKQTALNAGTHYDIISREMPLFSVMAMPAEGVKTDTLIAQLRQEIKDIADNGVSEEELTARQNPGSSQRNLRQRLHVFPSLHDGPPRSARFPNIPTNKKSTAAYRQSVRKKYRPPPEC